MLDDNTDSHNVYWHRDDKFFISTQSDCSNLYMSKSQDMAISSHKFDRANTLILQEGVKTVYSKQSKMY